MTAQKRNRLPQPAARNKLVPRYVQRRVEHSLIYLFLIIVFLGFAVGLYKGGVHLAQLTPEEITIHELPFALVLSLLRMTASYIASLFFAVSLGLLAARSKVGERIIIPLLDILQSVPVVAFFPAAISIFIGVTGGHRLGIELAATFLIFTSQAWNMAFAVYEATRAIPQESIDAIKSFGVRGSQRFWTLYAPNCVPRLVYNSILSWSNGWFFLVACEIISVGQVKYDLPGIGSFLARAAEQDQLPLVLWGLLALGCTILLLDFLIWRPATVWAERFRQESYSSDGSLGGEAATIGLPASTIARLAPMGKALKKMVKAFSFPVIWILREVLLPLLWDLPAAVGGAVARSVHRRYALPALARWNRLVARARWVRYGAFWVVGAALGAWAASSLVGWLRPPWPSFMSDIPLAILASTLRLTIALALSVAWTLPLILYVWKRPRLRQRLMTVAQLGASVPAIALFPLFILVLVQRLGGGMEAASVLLLMTGMQWYILFNGLSGAANIPGDLAEATRAMGLKRAHVWKRLVLPAIRPAMITGAITAWGGGWNALVVSESLIFKGERLRVNGLGALLNHAVYDLGDPRAIMICITAMVGWILLINALLWRPLYHSASERYRFDG